MKKSLGRSGVFAMLVALLFGCSQSNPNAKDGDPIALDISNNKENSLGIKGQPYATPDFEITVDSLELTKDIGISYKKMDAGEDGGFLILYATYKNTSSFGILPENGSIIIFDKDGKGFKEYDEIELIVGDEWGSLSTKIPAGLKQRVKYVYKIPLASKGNISYMPIKSEPKKQILVGEM